jgi:hypothetical protein
MYKTGRDKYEVWIPTLLKKISTVAIFYHFYRNL